jgi:FAD/FMN-containing dehydrogenase
VLKLFPKPRDTATAFIAVPSPAAAVELLSLASGISGNRVTGFEIMPRFGLDIVLRHVDGTRDPIAGEYPWYVLMDLSGGEAEGVLRAPCEAILETGFEKGLVLDATIAESKAQSDAFWYIRFALAEFQKFEGGSIKHDVSVPVSKMPEFIEQGCAAAVALVPGCRPLPFGHIGDGNVHFNISQPVGADTKEFLSRWEEMNDAIHALVLAHNGSVSAEHGIGRMKSHMMTAIKSPVELEMMRSIKHLFDPKNILNPGKMLPPEGRPS